MRNHDLVFLKHFSQVIGFLVAVTIALILLGAYFNATKPEEPNPAKEAATLARIQPVGAVYAGSTGAAAQAQAAAAAAAAAAEAMKGQVAFEGSLDGSVIFNGACGVCHNAGPGPVLTQAAWAARIPQGKDTLYKHAIEGFQGPAGVMPARGGNPALSDEQVKATVDWMLAQLK